MSFRLIDAVISDETDGLTDSRKLGSGGERGGEKPKKNGIRDLATAKGRMVRRNFADFAGEFRGGRGGTLCFWNS